MTVLAGSPAGAATSSAACDRECLKGFMTQYINAMLAHKPESLQVASNYRFTEDEQDLKVGEGFWKEISGSVAWRLDVIDVRAGGIGSLFSIKGSSLILYGVRLKITNNKISEIETIVIKNSTINSGDDETNPPQLGVTEREIKRIPNAKYVLVPASEKTYGHFTHLHAAFWKEHVAQFLKELPPQM